MKNLSKRLSKNLTLSENYWHHLFEIDELFNSILSYLPIPTILINSSLVCRKWYDKINRDDIHSLWPYLTENIWRYISELVPTNQVFIYNKSINDCEQNERFNDDPNYSLSLEDVKLREEFKLNLQKQIEIYMNTKLRSKRQTTLLISNYLFSINRCSLLVDKKSTFMEPNWIRGLKGNEFSLSIPQFLQTDLRSAQKKGICCDWSEIAMNNWFFSMSDLELKLDSVLLTKRKDNCWTIIHSETFQKGRKNVSNTNTDSSPVDQRKDWNFLLSAKKKTTDTNRQDSEDEEESSGSNGSSTEEEIITDIWKKIRMKRASKSLISTFEGRFKPVWIQPKFVKQANTNYFEIPQPLEPTPKKNFKVLNHIVSRWLYELDKYNLLSLDFILTHAMRILYYLYNGCIPSNSHSLMVGSPLLIENTIERHVLKKIRMWKKSNERKNFKNYYSSVFLNTGKDKSKSICCLSVCCESLLDNDDIGSIIEEKEPFSFEFSEYQL